MSCKQDINIDQECYFLTYLEGCEERRLYPPMQLQENENFVVVYGTLTPNQFSISKDNFDVDLNGENYTDKDRFIAQMSLELNCINDKYSGGGGGGCDLTQVETDLQEMIGNQETIIDELQTLASGVQSIPKYNGLSFTFNSPDSAVGGGLTLPATIGRFSFILRSGETLNYYTDAVNPRVQSLQDLCDVFNSQVDLVSLNILSGNDLVIEEAKLSPNAITALTISNDDDSEASTWIDLTNTNEELDNFSKIRRTLKDIKNEVETSNKQFAVYDTQRIELDDGVFDFTSLSPFPNTVVGASILVESGQFRHLVQGETPRNPTFSPPIQGILSSSGANIKIGKTPEFPLQDKDEFVNWKAICDTGDEAIINVIFYKFKY